MSEEFDLVAEVSRVATALERIAEQNENVVGSDPTPAPEARTVPRADAESGVAQDAYEPQGNPANNSEQPTQPATGGADQSFDPDPAIEDVRSWVESNFPSTIADNVEYEAGKFELNRERIPGVFVKLGWIESESKRNVWKSVMSDHDDFYWQGEPEYRNFIRLSAIQDLEVEG